MIDGEFSLALRVYIEDTDAGGIVYYVNYLKFMERARTEFMRDLGFDKSFIFDADLMFVVRDVNVRYRSPARLDENLRVTASVLELGGAYVLFQQTVCRGEELLADASIKIVCVDGQGVKPRRMPATMVQRLRAARHETRGNN